MLNLIKSRLHPSIRNFLRYFKNPHYSLLRFCLAIISKKRIITGAFSGILFEVPNFNTAMLIGTWELELKDQVSKLLLNHPSKVLCIGAAEGYYAVGFASKLPACKVYAFESQEKYRNILLNLSSVNHCKNVVVHGECTTKILHQFLTKDNTPSLIICDIEGGEIELLDLNKIPELQSCSILVEIHEMYVTECEKTIIDRFKKTHSWRIIQGKKRTLKDLPKQLNFLRFISSSKRILELMGEGRPYPMNWVYLEPK